MEVITNYKNVADLKKKIIAHYLIFAIRQQHHWREILADKEWACTKDEEHIQSRSRAENIVKEVTKQCKLLNKLPF